MSAALRRLTGLIAAVAAVTALALTTAPAPSTAAAATPAADAVVPIDWDRFDAGLPADAQAERTRAILLNSSEYTLRTWFPATYGDQTGEYLDLGGVGEGQIRPPGSAALGLATVLATGAYDAEATGVPEEQAREVAIRLITSIAYRHESNSAGGWGTAWQSALWAFNAAFGGWLLWDDLPAADRERLARMVRDEADVFLDYTVPYYQRPDGTVVTPGDSKAEENAWNAAFLNLAVAMMPANPNVAVWQDKALELMVSAYARPSDLHDDTVVNGKPLSDWLNGSNIFEDGTLVNHSRIHPDYFTSIANSVGAPLAYALAGRDTPQAALHNAGVVYEALADHVFAAPPYAAPGGTIYVRDAAGAATANVYYPQGNDWGTGRQLHFLLLDTLADAYGFDAGSDVPAGDWAAAHAQRALDMQARFDDGRTYGAASEDTYSGREQWVALLAARTYLTHWLGHNAEVGFTNEAFPVRPGDHPGAALTVAAAASYPRGVATPLTATVRSESAAPLNRLALELDLPDGWQATRVGETPATVLPPGATAMVTWQVTAPDDTAAETAELAVTARYRHYGTSRELGDTAAVAVPPGVNVARGRPVTVSSQLRANTGGALAVDGGFADASRWLSAESDPAPWLVVDLGRPVDIAEIHVYSGYVSTNHDPTTTLKDFAVEARTPAGWQQVAAYTGNVAHRVVADGAGLTGDQVRLSVTDPSGSTIDVTRVFELEVYQEGS